MNATDGTDIVQVIPHSALGNQVRNMRTPAAMRLYASLTGQTLKSVLKLIRLIGLDRFRVALYNVANMLRTISAHAKKKPQMRATIAP